MWKKIIKDFVHRNKKERYFFFADSKKRRDDLYYELLHVGDFDPACITDVSKKHVPLPKLISELKKLGASKKCWAYSRFERIDSKYVDFKSAMELIYKHCSATILYFEDRGLAYFEGDHGDRMILRVRSDRQPI